MFCSSGLSTRSSLGLQAAQSTPALLPSNSPCVSPALTLVSIRLCCLRPKSSDRESSALQWDQGTGQDRHIPPPKGRKRSHRSTAYLLQATQLGSGQTGMKSGLERYKTLALTPLRSQVPRIHIGTDYF